MSEEILYLIVFAYGLIVGSFFNVCICRIPKGLSIAFPASHCPSCKTQIKWWQNIPVFSYLILKGKCYYCHNKISILYPCIEFLTAVLAVLIALKYYHLDTRDFLLKISIYYIFFGSLVISSFIDLKYYIIPDRFTIGGILLGVIISTLHPQLHGFSFAKEGFIYSFVSFLICFSVLNSVRMMGTFFYKREAMGFGDIKLVGAFGAFLGWKLGLLSIFFASMIGSVFGICSVIFSYNKLRSEIPFGPYLSLGAFLALMAGDKFLLLYKQFVAF